MCCDVGLSALAGWLMGRDVGLSALCFLTV